METTTFTTSNEQTTCTVHAETGGMTLEAGASRVGGDVRSFSGHLRGEGPDGKAYYFGYSKGEDGNASFHINAPLDRITMCTATVAGIIADFESSLGGETE